MNGVNVRERLQQALQGYERSRNQYIAVPANELHELASQGGEDDPVAQALRKGSGGQGNRPLAVRVDDVFHLLEGAEVAEAAPQPQRQTQQRHGEQAQPLERQPAEQPKE